MKMHTSQKSKHNGEPHFFPKIKSRLSFDFRFWLALLPWSFPPLTTTTYSLPSFLPSLIDSPSRLYGQHWTARTQLTLNGISLCM